MSCEACDVRIDGHFAFNEFSQLSDEDLHFLRTLIQCEGRIRDMESALGLSYPTIRTRLTEFKDRLTSTTSARHTPLVPQGATERATASPSEILEQLKSGEIPYTEALTRIKSSKGKSKETKK